MFFKFLKYVCFILDDMEDEEFEEKPLLSTSAHEKMNKEPSVKIRSHNDVQKAKLLNTDSQNNIIKVPESNGVSNQGFISEGPLLNQASQNHVLQEPFSNLINEECMLDGDPLLDLSNQNDVLETPTYNVVTYKSRWLILFIFSMNTMMNGLLFMSLSPINNIACNYYRVESDKIEWLSNLFMLTYTILALPSSYLMSRWGVRPVIMIASCLHVISASFHYAGYHRDRFWLVLGGQGFAAVAFCMILQVPGKLSSVWFPENEGATATSIGVFMNLFGVSVGFLQPSMMVEESEDMTVIQTGLTRFFSSQLVITVVIALLTSAFKEQPPTPARSHSYSEAISFSKSLKLLWHNKDFVILSQSYGIYYGLFVTFSVLVNPLITSKFPHGYEHSLGWMGFSCDMAAIVACLLIGIMLDMYHVYRLTAVLLNVLSMLVWLSFVLVLTNTADFTGIFALYVAVGVFGVPFFASGIEQAAEMTYPVSEETSSTIILILGNLYGFIFIAVLGMEAEINHTKIAGYAMVGLYFISTVLAFFTKTELKRSNKNHGRRLETEVKSDVRLVEE